jgi:NAD(P)-dependent dehydrogenase (short-subunit alcohol dehydrogenase family)
MKKRLSGKVALVTGSTSGIGKAIVERFAEQGAKVVVTGRRQELGQRIVSEMNQAGGEARFFRADISNDQECEAIVQCVVETFGGLDILVNNAALLPRKPDGSMADGPLHITETEYWDRTWNVSLRSTFLISKLAIPHLLSSERPTIINIASNHGVTGCGMDVYSAIKGAIISLTRSMAVSYGHKIRVNCISPGMVIVERTQLLWDSTPEMHEQVQEGYLTRIGHPDDIANCALYLASDEAEYITGANFVIDGGASIHGVIPPGPQETRAKLTFHQED